MENEVKPPVEVQIKHSETRGKDEVYWHFFKCPNCGSNNIIGGSKFCDECGSKINWIKDIELD